MGRAAAAAFGLLILAAGGAASAAGVDARALAARIRAQLALERGERVLLLAGPSERPGLVEVLRLAVEGAGGSALVRIAGAPTDAPLPEFDAVVALPGATGATAEYRAAHAALSGRRRAVHFHWRGAEPSPSAWKLPGHTLPADDVIDAVYQRAVLETDCAALGARMRRFEEALRAAEVHVTTPLGTNLRFRVGDRPVNIQDGDASAARAARARIRVDRDVELPCGVLRVAPLENTVKGRIAFPPARWDGRDVGTVFMHFEEGRVVRFEAEGGREHAVADELNQGGLAAHSFRECALGFNPLLAVPAASPWIPYYGYGAGVVRLSLGDNTELGGAVAGGYVRWNFFTDATVRVGSDVWVEAGVLEPR